MDDFIGYLFVNGFFSLIIAVIGSHRRIGGVGAFFISFFFSVVIGLIVVLLSKSNVDIEREEEMLRTQKKTLEEQRKSNIIKEEKSFIEDLTKLTELREKGLLTLKEFDNAKNKLINSDLYSEKKSDSTEVNSDQPFKEDEKPFDETIRTNPIKNIEKNTSIKNKKVLKIIYILIPLILIVGSFILIRITKVRNIEKFDYYSLKNQYELYGKWKVSNSEINQSYFYEIYEKNDTYIGVNLSEKDKFEILNKTENKFSVNDSHKREYYILDSVKNMKLYNHTGDLEKFGYSTKKYFPPN